MTNFAFDRLLALLLPIAVVAAYHIFLVARVVEQPLYVTVRLEELIESYSVTAVESGLQGEALRGDIERYVATLDLVLEHVASEGNMVILADRAVAAGAQDVTDQIKRQIEIAHQHGGLLDAAAKE